MLPLLKDVEPLLRTQRFGRAIRGEDEVDSTNTRAWMWANAGAPEGAVFIAEYQSAGRGRLRRTWEARPGLNLTFSIVLYPGLPPERLGLVTLAAGLAVAEALEPFSTPILPWIKWPNDVLLEGKKCCGILMESAVQPERTTLILGIGLNVNQDAFPPELGGRATSLLLATGRHTPRAALLATLLERLEAHYDTLLTGRAEQIRKTYERRLAGRGEAVAFRFADNTERVQGILRGITDTGALILETSEGTQSFLAGEITSHLQP